MKPTAILGGLWSLSFLVTVTAIPATSNGIKARSFDVPNTIQIGVDKRYTEAGYDGDDEGKKVKRYTEAGYDGDDEGKKVKRYD